MGWNHSSFVDSLWDVIQTRIPEDEHPLVAARICQQVASHFDWDTEDESECHTLALQNDEYCVRFFGAACYKIEKFLEVLTENGIPEKRHKALSAVWHTKFNRSSLEQ